MDRDRYSAIAHATHVFANPVSGEKADAALGIVEAGPGDVVVDVGAGGGEFSIRLVERTGCSAIVIERSPHMARIARERAAGRIAPERFEVVESDAADALAARPALVCAAMLIVGASQALGGRDAALAEAARRVRPGGCVVLGEGFWRTRPDAEYLAALGATEGEMGSHADNVRAIEAAGFTPIGAWVASEDDWDEYEWRYCRNVERWAREHPDDPDCAAFVARARAWRDIVLRWGRATLGFALYAGVRA